MRKWLIAVALVCASGVALAQVSGLGEFWDLYIENLVSAGYLKTDADGKVFAGTTGTAGNVQYADGSQGLANEDAFTYDAGTNTLSVGAFTLGTLDCGTGETDCTTGPCEFKLGSYDAGVASCDGPPDSGTVSYDGALVMHAPDSSDDFFTDPSVIGSSSSLIVKDNALDSWLETKCASDTECGIEYNAAGASEVFRIDGNEAKLILQSCHLPATCSATDDNIELHGDVHVGVSGANQTMTVWNAGTTTEATFKGDVLIEESLTVNGTCVGCALQQTTNTTAGNQDVYVYDGPTTFELIERFVDATETFEVYAHGSGAQYHILTTLTGPDGYTLAEFTGDTATINGTLFATALNAATSVMTDYINVQGTADNDDKVCSSDLTSNNNHQVCLGTDGTDGELNFYDNAAPTVVASTIAYNSADDVIELDGSPLVVVPTSTNGPYVVLAGSTNTSWDTGDEVCAADAAHPTCKTTFTYNESASASDKSFGFQSPSGASGTFYVGGYYEHDSGSNDFNPSVTWGTANISYAAHVYLVCGSDPATNPVIRVTGTSITDSGTRTASDTEDITVTGAADAYYETAKKFLGQVTIEKISGDDTLCNYGWASYYDWGNRDYTVTGVTWFWRGGANDASADLELLHHTATGWTYNAGSTADPPTPITGMSSVHTTEAETLNGAHHKFKRTGLSTAVEGSGSEGVMFRMTTSANKSIEQSDIILSITSVGGELACSATHTDYFSALCW